MRGIIDAVPHPVFVKDEESRFVLVNQAMCDIMGHTFEELIGRTDRDFVPAGEAEMYMARDRLVLETGEPNENEEPLSVASHSRLHQRHHRLPPRRIHDASSRRA
jgi:PAS domain S-box-containing protein